MAAVGLRFVRLKYRLKIQDTRLPTFIVQQTLPLPLNKNFDLKFLNNFSDTFPLFFFQTSQWIFAYATCDLAVTLIAPLPTHPQAKSLFIMDTKPEANKLVKNYS